MSEFKIQRLRIVLTGSALLNIQQQQFEQLDNTSWNWFWSILILTKQRQSTNWLWFDPTTLQLVRSNLTHCATGFDNTFCSSDWLRVEPTTIQFQYSYLTYWAILYTVDTRFSSKRTNYVKHLFYTISFKCSCSTQWATSTKFCRDHEVDTTVVHF